MRFQLLVPLALGIVLFVGGQPGSAQRPLPDLTPSGDDHPLADNVPGITTQVPEPRNPRQSFEIRVFRLKRIRADQAVATVQHLFSGDRGFQQDVRLDANPQENLILMRGTRDRLREIEALLTKLESIATENGVTEQASPGWFVPYASQNENAATNELQQQIRNLALRYQSLTDQGSKEYDASGKEAERVAEELRTVVERAFDMRQQRQQQQVQRLQQRLAALQGRVQEQEERRQPMIDQMVSNLLSLGKQGSQAQPRLQRLLDTFGAMGPVTAPKSERNEAPPGPSDARDAAGETAYRAALAEFERAKELMRKGYISEDAFKKAQADLAAVQAELETNVRRLELDLEEAEIQLKFASEEYDEARRLQGEHVISTSEVRKRELNRRQAELKVQRAQLELDAARRRMQK